MAGMLPGVEAARRRRFHGSSGWSDSSSSSVIGCGFAYSRTRPSYDSHLTSTSSLQQRSMMNQSDQDEKLGGIAREAKERLDGRLRGHRKSEIKRQNSEEGLRGCYNVVVEETEAKSGGLKRFGWGKMGGLNWKSSQQDECAICLEQFKIGEKLTRLPCAHRFHSKCLLPWLESNAHCPCCRMGISTSL